MQCGVCKDEMSVVVNVRGEMSKRECSRLGGCPDGGCPGGKCPVTSLRGHNSNMDYIIHVLVYLFFC